MANSNSFLSPRNSFDSPIFREDFIFHHEIVCSVYSLESPQWVHSTYNYCVGDRKKKSLNYRHLLSGLASWFTLSGSNYPYLEQISMVPKIFEPLEFDYTYGKHWRLRWDGSSRAVSSGSKLFAILLLIFDWNPSMQLSLVISNTDTSFFRFQVLLF